MFYLWCLHTTYAHANALRGTVATIDGTYGTHFLGFHKKLICVMFTVTQLELALALLVQSANKESTISPTNSVSLYQPCCSAVPHWVPPCLGVLLS